MYNELRRRISIAHCALIAFSLFASPAHAHGDFGPLVAVILGAVIFVVMCFVFLAASIAPPGQKGAWAMIILAGMPLSAMLIFGTITGVFANVSSAARANAFIGALIIFVLLWTSLFVYLYRLRKQVARDLASAAAAKAAATALSPEQPAPLLSAPAPRSAPAPAPRRHAQKSPLTATQKLGFGFSALAVCVSVGAYLFWHQIQARQEIAAEREKEAKEIAKQAFEADQNAREARRERLRTNLYLEQNPRFSPISVKEFSEDIGNFPEAKYGRLTMKPCYVTATDPASASADEAMMILFRETQSGGIRLFSRGFHSGVELKKRQGSDRNSVSFFGKPEGSQSNDLVLGAGETRLPIESDFVLEGGSYKPVEYRVTLRITEPLKCDWTKPRCHAAGETSLPDLPKVNFTEYCADKTNTRFFPTFAYGK